MKKVLKGPKGSLGKGLANLLGEVSSEQETAGSQELDINLIRANPENPRKNFDLLAIEELAQTIEEHGVLQPILVKKIDTGFQVISGERRLRACRKLGFKSLPCIIKDLSEDKILEVALIENIQREQLDAVEEARVYESLLKKHSWTQAQLAGQIGKKRTTIANRVRLLQLPEKVQVLIADGRLSEGQVRPLVTLGNENIQIKIAKEIEKKNLSARQSEQLVKRYKGDLKKNVKSKKKDAAIKSYEKKLSEFLEARVLLRHNDKSGSGKIIIDYFSLDELERLEGVFRNK